MLAAGALVASLLAVGASPVGAVEEKADHKAATSACVGDALGDQMYTDVSDMHAFKDAINCIGYYGITNGTGDGSTFSPNDDVTRAEMAVFLARAAGAAGVDLGDAMDAGFDDIGDTWAEAQDAINQLADKGILPKGDSYRPNDAMTRAEMAIALIGLLNKASSDVKINDDGTITLSVGTEGTADDHFADARALSPLAVDRASAALYELGVTNGTGTAAKVDPKKSPLDTNFDPNGTVNRGQMAAFITRALAHTSARPEGVTAQALTGGKVLVSLRDANFAPVANEYVEVFFVETADGDDALTSRGACDTSLVQRSGNGATRDGDHVCEIDGADLLTNGNGNAETQAITVPDDGVVAWAWTGDLGDEVGRDTALYRLPVAKTPPDPRTSTTALISNNLAGSLGKMGSSVTVTLQLRDARGDVSGGAQSADEPAKWLITINTYRGPTVVAGSEVLRSTVPVTSDSDGKATFVLASLPDPRANETGDMWTVGYVVGVDLRGCDPDADDPTAWACDAPHAADGTVSETAPVAPTATVVDGTGTAATTGSVTFSDARAVASKVSVETSSYVLVAGRSNQTAVNRATVKVTDQFGDPVRNATVTLTSDLGRSGTTGTPTPDGNNSSLPDTTNGGTLIRDYTTGSDGSYTFGYTWTGTGGDVESLTAIYDPTPDDETDASDDITADADSVAAGNQPTTVRWAQDADEAGSAEAILDGNVEAKQIIVEETDGTPDVLVYDANDRFNISEAGADASTPTTMADFEKKLAEWLATPGTTGELVTWANYDARARNVSVFTLHVS